MTRLGLQTELRRSLACANIMENVMGTVRRVLSQPETPAIGLNDAALDRRSQERSIEGLSQAEGLQAIANPAPEQNIKQPRPADEAKAA